jgi:N,N'-diacetyllegionaminate synthase
MKVPRQVFIIAEVAQNHDGSLGLAHAFIDAVAGAGADAVKFQTHIADAESTSSEPFRVGFSYQDKSRFEYWKRMEFTKEQWIGLKTHAQASGIGFLSSPFSSQAVDLLESIGVDAWKIGSGEALPGETVKRVAQTGKHIYASTGMSSFADIDGLVRLFEDAKVSFTLMQCTTNYPTAPERIGLNVIREFQSRYGCSVGLSDHSGTIFPALAAVTYGITAVEVHVTLSREMFGPDIAASITTQELRQLVSGIRLIEAILANPVDKDRVADELAPLKKMFGKSAVARRHIPANWVLSAADIAFKKPGTGIPESEIDRLIGKTTARDIAKDSLFAFDDLI